MSETDRKAQSFIVKTVRGTESHAQEPRANVRTVTLPGGKRVRVMKRDVLNRAIESAMKEFA